MKRFTGILLLWILVSCGSGETNHSEVPLDNSELLAQALDSCDTFDQELESLETLAISINGSGYLVFQAFEHQVYTRSAKLRVSPDGFLVNQCGFVMQGFAADQSGNINSALQDDIFVGDGGLSNLIVEPDGVLYVDVGGGDKKPKAQLALSSFSSPYQLTELRKSFFLESPVSGPPNISIPMSGGLGELNIDSETPSILDMTLDLEAGDAFIPLISADGDRVFVKAVKLFSDQYGSLIDQNANKLTVFPEDSHDRYARLGEGRLDYQVTKAFWVQTNIFHLTLRHA